MFTHVVMWRFKPEIKDEEKAGLKAAMKEHLEALTGKVPGLVSVHFITEPAIGSTHDMALVTVHESEDAISVYGSHPEHVKVADTYVRPYTCERACINYKAF